MTMVEPPPMDPLTGDERLLGVDASAFLADQSSKAWALEEFADGGAIGLFPSVSLRFVFNPGVAFGLGSSAGLPLAVVLLLIEAGLISWIGFQVIRRVPLLETLPLAFAAGGAFGNIYDRSTRSEGPPLGGEVVDFIAVDWFAVFNVADIFPRAG